MKLQKLLLILLLMCLFFVAGCRKENSSDAPEPVDPTPVMPVDEPEYDGEQELTEYLETAQLKPSTNAVVHTGQSGGYMELTLKKGSRIDVLQKRGYTFEGYETKDGVQYVDSNGTVVKEYIGNNTLLLKAAFLPAEFTVRFFLDGRQTKDLNSVIYSFDKPLDPSSIHLGKELNGTCIIGYKDKAGNLVVKANTKSINIKDLGASVDYEANTVDLHAVTTDVALSHVRANTYQVSDKGFLKQSLDSKGTKYDFVVVDECVDIDALKVLGYANATISIECDIKAESGKQQIKILRDWPETEKEVKDVTLFDSKKVDYTNTNTSYTGSVTVPIDEIGESIYIVYTAHGLPIKSNGWKSDGMEVKVSFSK